MIIALAQGLTGLLDLLLKILLLTQALLDLISG